MNLKMKKVINILAIIYCISIFMNYLLIEQIFKTPLLGRTRYIISLINISIAVLIFLANKDFKIKKKACYYFCINVIPYILIFFIMIIKWLLIGDIDIFNQITVFLYWIIPICQMQSAVYLFGKKAVDYTFFATVANYMLCIISYLCLYKLDGIIHFFNYVEVGVSPLEVHELIFTMGLFFIYYCFFEDKNEKKHRMKVIMSTICLFLGFKRIEILALILVAVIYTIIKLLKDDKKQIVFMNTISIICVTISIIYIVITHNGSLRLLAKKYNINFKSRLEAYEYFKEDYELTLTYKGKGLGYVIDKLKLADNSLHGIGDLHNDILKLYIELGAIIWFVYFINFSLLQTNRMKKQYGCKMAKVYFILMIFTYILYFTDNVNRYLNYILVFTMIPYVYFLKIQDSKEIEVKQIDEQRKKGDVSST